MSYVNFIPEVWEARLQHFLMQTSVFGGITNNDYDGMIDGVDQTVRINTVGGVTVKDYAKNTDLEVEELDSSQTTLQVSQAKYWGVKVNDVDQVQTNLSLVNTAVQSAAYELQKIQDTYVLGRYGDAGITYGTTASSIEITAANVIAFFAHMNRLMTDADLPDVNRWVVLPPWMIEKMVLAKIFTSTSNDSIIDNGRIGNFLGFDIRRSNRVQTAANGQDTIYKPIFGVGTIPITFVNAFAKTKAESVPKQFAEQVFGLAIYDAKVIRPDFLACASIKEGAES